MIVDNTRLRKLAGIITEASQFRPALKVIAAELVAEADLREFLAGEAEAGDIAGEMVEGRWIEMLKDEIVDLLMDKKGA